MVELTNVGPAITQHYRLAMTFGIAVSTIPFAAVLLRGVKRYGALYTC
jgi:hypothetical protein